MSSFHEMTVVRTSLLASQTTGGTSLLGQEVIVLIKQESIIGLTQGKTCTEIIEAWNRIESDYICRQPVILTDCVFWPVGLYCVLTEACSPHNHQ